MDKPSQDEPIALFLLSVENGEKWRLTEPPREILADSDPAFSPDGRTLAFTRSTGVKVADLYVVKLSAELAPVGGSKRLTFDNRSTSGPAWTSDGRQIVFSSNRSRSSDLLWRIAAAGGEQPQRLESMGENGQNPAISPTGDRLVYTLTSADYNIWRIELPAKPAQAATAVLMKSSLIASSRFDGVARFSPDGTRVAFSSDRSGTAPGLDLDRRWP